MLKQKPSIKRRNVFHKLICSASLFSMYPSLQQSQPFNVNAMSRSGLPAMPASVIGTSPLGFAGIRAPQMRPALTPSQMAFSRQLSSMTGISIPISAQPGMGIVGISSFVYLTD